MLTEAERRLLDTDENGLSRAEVSEEKFPRTNGHMPDACKHIKLTPASFHFFWQTFLVHKQRKRKEEREELMEKMKGMKPEARKTLEMQLEARLERERERERELAAEARERERVCMRV